MLVRSVLDDLPAVFDALHSVSDHFISDSDALNSVLHRDQRQRVHYRQSSFAQSSLLTEFIRTEFNICRVQCRQSSISTEFIIAEFNIGRVHYLQGSISAEFKNITTSIKKTGINTPDVGFQMQSDKCSHIALDIWHNSHERDIPEPIQFK